ncbi:MAG TPA: inositol monophosphatase [Stellaceae bacterium]|nr:inositol monophosphatase [Stellaceae bacterium]
MIDVEQVAALIRETAEAVIVPRFRQLRQEDIREKKPGDFVTIADIEAERMLTERLRADAPGSVVLGEEATAEDPSRLDLLAGEAPVWVIDPIDGTGNFARGAPGFAVILALIERAELCAGWIYDPLRGEMVAAEAGGGAWSDGRRLAVDGSVDPARSIGAAYGRSLAGPRAAKVLGDSGRVGEVQNLGSSALEYNAIALGRAHFSLHSRSLPWDHAAGLLIVREAGGIAGFADESGYNPRILDRPVLAAANRAVWETVRSVVGPFS